MKLVPSIVVFCALCAARPAAQAPCTGDDCQGSNNQLTAAATQIERDKTQFVSSVRQLIEAVAGAYGDEGPAVSAALDGMAGTLVSWDKAIRTYRSVIADTAGDGPAVHVALAAVYLERGTADAALREAVTASRLDPWRQDAYVLQGLAHELARHPAEAARAFEKASTMPSNSAALYGLAQRLIAVGDEKGATAALRKFSHAAENSASRDGSRPAVAPFVRVGLLRQSPGVAPIFAPASYTKGFTLLAHGAFEQAIAELKTAAAHDELRAHDTSREDGVGQGAAALRRGDVAAAIERFRAVVADAPGRSEARRMLGLAYQTDDQYEPSVDQLRAAVALNAADDRSRVALADVLLLAGRSRDAEHVLQDAIDVIPGSGRAHYQLGLLYKSIGRSGDALRELENAAAVAPIVGQDFLYDTLGAWYVNDANLDGARAAYRRRVDANPNSSDAHRKLGQIYLEQGRHEEALAEFAAALLLDPRNAEAQAARAQLHLRLGEYAAAETWARRALALSRGDATAQYALGTSLVRLGRVEEGAGELETFQRLQSEGLARANREWELKLIRQAAQASIDAGDLDRAAVLLQQVVALDPDAGSSYISLGIVLARAGRFAGAIDAFLRALERRAGPDVRRHLAEAYAALGQWPESRAERAIYDRAKADRLRALNPSQHP